MQQDFLLENSFQEGILMFLQDLATPRALSVAILIRYGEWEQLTELKFYPSNTLLMSSKDTHGINAAKRDYQATELLRKADFIPLARDLEQEAVDNFVKIERENARTNARLEFLHPNARAADVAVSDPSGALTMFVKRVRKEISSLLGRLPDDVEPMFGPGSVFEVALDGSVSVDTLTVLDKLDRIQPAVTEDAHALFTHYYRSCGWGRWNHSRWAGPQIVRANRFATVPKDATKHRTIGVEPGGNIWLQKGVGTFIRSRLQKCWGLLLPEGKSEQLHHELAQVGSQTGQYATIDLSNASDTIARTLVEVLLPPDWFDLLNALRVKNTLVKGKVYRLEKFSSMGNGFTFELETLIFAAIARSLVSTGYAGRHPHVSVYGDDIIVPTERARDVVAALRFFGFTPNPRKTFVNGLFRESCGGDFMAGTAVMPTRITSFPTEPQHWISLCNSVHRTWDREVRGDPAYRFWKWAHAHLSTAVRRCQGPSEYGDVVIHWNEPRLVYLKDTQRYAPRMYQPSFIHMRMERHDPNAILAYALLGGDPEGPVPRGDNGVGGYRIHDPSACTCRTTPEGWLATRCPHCTTTSRHPAKGPGQRGVAGYKTIQDRRLTSELVTRLIAAAWRQQFEH